MSREESILRAALRSGLTFELPPTKLFEFAELIAAAEREACAKVADDMTLPDWTNEQIAAAIRARGQE